MVNMYHGNMNFKSKFLGKWLWHSWWSDQSGFESRHWQYFSTFILHIIAPARARTTRKRPFLILCRIIPQPDSDFQILLEPVFPVSELSLHYLSLTSALSLVSVNFFSTKNYGKEIFDLFVSFENVFNIKFCINLCLGIFWLYQKLIKLVKWLLLWHKLKLYEFSHQ